VPVQNGHHQRRQQPRPLAEEPPPHQEAENGAAGLGHAQQAIRIPQPQAGEIGRRRREVVGDGIILVVAHKSAVMAVGYKLRRVIYFGEGIITGRAGELVIGAGAQQDGDNQYLKQAVSRAAPAYYLHRQDGRRRRNSQQEGKGPGAGALGQQQKAGGYKPPEDNIQKP